MKTEFAYPENRAEFEAYIAANPDHVLEIDGAVMRVFTGNDVDEYNKRNPVFTAE